MDTATLKSKIADLAPRVAAFVSRNRAPRPLSHDERRLAVTDPQAFDALARKLQDETLEDMWQKLLTRCCKKTLPWRCAPMK